MKISLSIPWLFMIQLNPAITDFKGLDEIIYPLLPKSVIAKMTMEDYLCRKKNKQKDPSF